MKRDWKNGKGLSWDNAKRYVAAAVLASMMLMPGMAMAKSSDPADTVTQPVERVIATLRSVSWS